MPVMNGFELANEIYLELEKLKLFKMPKLIACTAVENIQRDEKWYDSPFSTAIIKPVSL